MKSDDTNVTDRITRRYRRQPGQLVAAAGAARADRKVVADRLAAAVGEDRWTVDKARTFLLVAAGGEPPDETALWEHAAKDRGVTVADGIRRVQRGANLDDGAGLAGEVSADAPGKRVFRGVACSPKAKPAPSGTAGNTVEQCRLKPLQRKALRSTKRVEVGKSKRKSRFNAWTTYAIRPFYCNRILEIGSGLGNITRILSPRSHYVATDVNPLYLLTLNILSAERPYIQAAYCDVTDLCSFPRSDYGYDTVICLNVIEHVEDDRTALNNIRSVLAVGGRAIILVPQGPRNMGTLDEVLGHRRRYTYDTLAALASDSSFKVSNLIKFNRMGSVAWYLNGKILRRHNFGRLQIWTLNMFTPLFRAEAILPFPPLSLIAVLENPSEAVEMTPGTHTGIKPAIEELR